MTDIQKIDFIKARIKKGDNRREIQAGLKMKFGSGVNNTVIRDIRAELSKKKDEEKDLKDTDIIPKIPNKKKDFYQEISITKAELWIAIESDEDLKGLKTWFTIKPNRTERKRRGLGDLVLLINELIKQKIEEEKEK